MGEENQNQRTYMHSAQDLIRLKRVPATSTFTDLISYYGLIVHRIASLSLKISKTSKESIRCTFTTLQNM